MYVCTHTHTQTHLIFHHGLAKEIRYKPMKSYSTAQIFITLFLSPKRTILYSRSHLQPVQNRSQLITSFLLLYGFFQPLLFTGPVNTFPKLVLTFFPGETARLKILWSSIPGPIFLTWSRLSWYSSSPEWQWNGAPNPIPLHCFSLWRDACCSNRCPSTGWFLLPPRIMESSLCKVPICSAS